MKKRHISGYVVAGIGLVAVGIALGALVGHGFDSSWTASQWGPLAAWVGSFLTAFTAGVSLWLGIEARRKSSADEAAANDRARVETQRHQLQLDHSQRLLRDQLDAQHITHQIEVVSDMWSDVTNLIVQADFFKDRIYEYHNGLIDEAAFYEGWYVFHKAATEHQISKTRTSIVVDSTALLGVIDKINEQYERIVRSTTEMFQMARRGQPSEDNDVPLATASINDYRGDLIFVVRKHVKRDVGNSFLITTDITATNPSQTDPPKSA